MDIPSLLNWCRERGFSVTQTSRGHWRVIIPNGGIIITSGTPSDRRAALNFRAQLRRELRKVGWPEDDMP